MLLNSVKAEMLLQQQQMVGPHRDPSWTAAPLDGEFIDPFGSALAPPASGQRSVVISPSGTITQSPGSALLAELKSRMETTSRATRYEASTLAMVMHVIRTERVELTPAEQQEFVKVAADHRSQRRDHDANLAVFDEGPPSQLTRTEGPPEAKATATITRDQYWANVRDTLQHWFPLSLTELAAIIGIAKGTLVYITDPSRGPRPSTARKVMDLFSLGQAVVGALGADAGRQWLATNGLAALRTGGVRELDRTVRAKLFARRRSEDAVPVDSHDEDVATQSGPYIAPAKFESEAF